MRFTEHELTVALAGAAKATLAAQRRDIRKGRIDIDDAWEALTKYERFQILDALGGQILPALVALPDVEVEAGTRAKFTRAQIEAAVEATLADGEGRLRRKAIVLARVQLLGAALAQLPPRQDPDALIVPDHL